MAFSLKWRSELSGAILREFESLVSSLVSWTTTEHNGDGTHTAITAESLSLQGALVGELTDLPFSATRYTASGGGAWVVAAVDQLYLRASRLGQLALVQFNLETTDTTGAAASDLVIRLPELAPLAGRNAASGTFGASHVCGVFTWIDTQNGTRDMGYVQAVTVASGVSSAPQLRLVKRDGATFANSNNLAVEGSALFPLNRNNQAVPF